MPKTTVLLIVDKSSKVASLNSWIDAANELDCHLSVLVAAMAQPIPTTAYGAIPYGGIVVTEEWQRAVKQDAEELSDKVGQIESAFSDAGISADVRGCHCELPLLSDEVADAANVSDFAAIPDGHGLDPVMHAKIVSSLLFQSPIALALHSTDPMSVLKPKKVFVAWKPGLPASRALHAALPQLQRAQEVVVGIFDPDMRAAQDGEEPGADVGTWLSRQGCTVDVEQLPSGGKNISECINAHAKQLGADVIVMGAYGHSKWQQRIFGGTTHMIIANAETPVIMAH